MNQGDEAASPALARVVARHSYGWLVAANLVGAWLALSLLCPAAGDALAPFTYGRWVPLHLDWQLYGWCSLPVVGALLAWCSAANDARALTPARIALTGWSLALALGGMTWLAGGVSGKLFLDWTGAARPLLPAAMIVLWGVLAWLTAAAWKTFSPVGRSLRLAVLAALLPVPAVLYWSMGREVYPAVNPDSGGATGAALLGSTLGIVAIFLLLPHLLRLAPQGSRRRAVSSSAPSARADWCSAPSITATCRTMRSRRSQRLACSASGFRCSPSIGAASPGLRPRAPGCGRRLRGGRC